MGRASLLGSPVFLVQVLAELYNFGVDKRLFRISLYLTKNHLDIILNSLYVELGGFMDSVKAEHQPQSVTKGPVEGIIIVDGRPRMERVDMPTISFTKERLKRLQEYYATK